ncbi:hypothetical protein HF998_00110 [Cellulomonas hominis]|uniref:MinD-like ATPase involved in chromosome partitioning or flagellar assembly n=1 Tax=Cellulomonas hominis TaxID=156981 RepID=A0A7W8WBC3_9CELL|nr:hypothetical protein [Cellulomonas hominis]MBB5474756.1 MinD-like ATPase involved in chromosome partitioning or flagellar assembly [Cellulomonas hominis]NKY05412.1 hypothetical protein [Cellulomonas hominis]
MGLLHLPSLHAALEACGVASVGGPDFRTAATAITTAGRAHPELALIVGDYAGPGQTPWLEKWVTRPRAAIVQLDPVAAGLGPVPSPIGGNTARAKRFAAPVMVAELLAEVGVACPEPLRDAFVAPDGVVMVAEPPQATPAADPATMPAASGLAPASLDAAPAPAAPAPAPARTAVRTPPAVHQPDSAPTPAASQATARATVPTPVAGAHTVLPIAGKGGVGKTTYALALGERAARLAKLRVAVLDGNRGQGDLRGYLRLSRAPLPTVYDVAAGAPAESVLVLPDQIAAYRPAGLERIHFAVALAPLDGMADRDVVTSAVYSEVLQAARSMADLVVVDTQIAESDDTSGLFDDVWVPALEQYAHMVGITNLVPVSIDNLSSRIRSFRDAGVDVDNISIVLNDVPAEIDYPQQRTMDHLGKLGWVRGRVMRDPAIIAATNAGEVPWDHPVLAPVLDQVLFAVTGLEEFAPKDVEVKTAKRRRGFLGLGR